MASLGPLLGVSLTPGSAGTAVSTERGVFFQAHVIVGRIQLLASVELLVVCSFRAQRRLSLTSRSSLKGLTGLGQTHSG